MEGLLIAILHYRPSNIQRIPLLGKMGHVLPGIAMLDITMLDYCCCYSCFD